MSEVRDDDLSSVNATLLRICKLEDSVPVLDISIKSMRGYYAIIIKNFNEFIDGANCNRQMIEDPDPKMGKVILWGVNPATGSFVVRLAMQGSGNPVMETAGIRYNQYDSVPRGGDGNGGGGGQRKRGRFSD